MRDESKIRAVPSLQEDCHQRNESHHRIEVLRIKLADDNQEGSRHDANEVNPELLCPQVVSRQLEDQVAEETTRWSGDDVEQAEHGSPATGGGLPKVGEVLQVVRAQDGVDRELAAEGTDVRGHQRDGLEGAEHLESFLSGRLDDDFGVSCVDGVYALSDPGVCLDIAGTRGDLLFPVVGRGEGSCGGFISKIASRGNNGDVVLLGGDGAFSFRPFTCGCIFCQE